MGENLPEEEEEEVNLYICNIGIGNLPSTAWQTIWANKAGLMGEIFFTQSG